MNRVGLVVAFVLVLPLGGSTRERSAPAAQQLDKRGAAAKADLEKLQGVWYHVSREQKGKQVVGEAKEILVAFRGNTVVFKKDTEVSQVGVLKRLDAASHPKKFDLIVTDGPNEGMTILAIYEVKDGLFRYCGGVDARPTSFTTKADDKGYVYCSSYKRAKR